MSSVSAFLTSQDDVICYPCNGDIALFGYQGDCYFTYYLPLATAQKLAERLAEAISKLQEEMEASNEAA